MRAKEQRHHVRLHHRSRRSRRSGDSQAPGERPPCRARRPTRPTIRWARRRPSRRSARSSWASGLAGCSPPCCSRSRASNPSCWNAAGTCAAARKTPGPCGARTSSTPESNVQFGEGGAGLFSDGKLYSQIKDPKFYGRKVMHEFVRAGAPRRNPVRQQAAHRHVQAHRRGGGDARRDHRSGRRSPVREQGERPADRRRPDRRCRARRRRNDCAAAMSCWRRDTAPATRFACSSAAACSSSPSPSRSAFASSIPSR